MTKRCPGCLGDTLDENGRCTMSFCHPNVGAPRREPRSLHEAFRMEELEPGDPGPILTAPQYETKRAQRRREERERKQAALADLASFDGFAHSNGCGCDECIAAYDLRVAKVIERDLERRSTKVMLPDGKTVSVTDHSRASALDAWSPWMTSEVTQYRAKVRAIERQRDEMVRPYWPLVYVFVVLMLFELMLRFVR